MEEPPVTQNANRSGQTSAVEGADIPGAAKVRCGANLVWCIRSCAPQKDQEPVDLDAKRAKCQPEGDVLRFLAGRAVRASRGTVHIDRLLDIDTKPLVTVFPQPAGDLSTPKTECTTQEAGTQNDREEVEQRALELAGPKTRRQQAPRKRRCDEGAKGKSRERSDIRDDRAAGIIELRQEPSSAGMAAAGPVTPRGRSHENGTSAALHVRTRIPRAHQKLRTPAPRPRGRPPVAVTLRPRAGSRSLES